MQKKIKLSDFPSTKKINLYFSLFFQLILFARMKMNRKSGISTNNIRG